MACVGLVAFSLLFTVFVGLLLWVVGLVVFWVCNCLVCSLRLRFLFGGLGQCGGYYDCSLLRVIFDSLVLVYG